MSLTFLCEFKAPFEKKGKHRHKCRTCRKLIQDGEMTLFKKYRKEEHYPIKGYMGFTVWHYYHSLCEEK